MTFLENIYYNYGNGGLFPANGATCPGITGIGKPCGWKFGWPIWFDTNKKFIKL